MQVTKEYLVKGAIYALEQCGLLLLDAVALADQKSYSSAVVLAAFAHEELGRSLILIEFFDNLVRNNIAPTPYEIKKACRDHVKKQEAAQISITLNFSNSSPEGQMLLARINLMQAGQIQSEEFKKLDKELANIMDKQRELIP